MESRSKFGQCRWSPIRTGRSNAASLLVSPPEWVGKGAGFRYRTGARALSSIHNECEYFVAMPGDPDLHLSHGRWVSTEPGKRSALTANSDTPFRLTASPPADDQQ